MDEHYFTADPSVAFKRAPVHASVWGQELDLVSGSGVFAQGGVDIGTAILFRETEPPTPGRILDLGCGYGLIGLAAAAAVRGADVTAVDVNERAVLLANENAVSLGVADRFRAVTRVSFFWGVADAEGLAVLEHGVDLPPLAVRGALDPELVLLGVAAGGAALVDRGQPLLGEAGLLGVDGVDVGHLDAEVVDRAALAGVLDQDQLERRLGHGEVRVAGLGLGGAVPKSLV